MLQVSRMELKKLSPNIFLLAFLLVVLFVFFNIFIFDKPWLEKIWVMLYREPVQKEFGIKVAEKEIPSAWNPSDRIKCLMVEELVPQGKAERLGLRKGDLLLGGASHIFFQEGGFYSFMAHWKNHPDYELRVVNVIDFTSREWRDKVRIIKMSPRLES